MGWDQFWKWELGEQDERADRKRAMLRNPEAGYTMCDMDQNEFTGQCIGGPDDGNMITASVSVVQFGAVFNRWLDGSNARPVPQKISGTYEWDVEHGVFHWNGGNNARQG